MTILTREYECLIELEKVRNITRAARNLGLQQPGLSKILLQLEDKLGRKLFLRKQDGLHPTAFASHLARDLREVRGDWESRFQTLVEREDRIAGEFRIGCHAIVGSTYLIDFVSDLSLNHPEIVIDFDFKTSNLVTADVVEGRTQFGLVANPVVHPELVSKSISKDAIYLYFNTETGPRTPPQGALIYYNPEMLHTHKTLRLLKKNKLIAIPDYEMVLRLALKQKGTGALLPESLAEKHVALKRTQNAYVRSDINLIYRADLPKTKAVRFISDGLKNISV